MRYRIFGNTNLEVSEIGMGCARVGGLIDQKDPKEIVRTIAQAFERGINFYDTADMYGQGESEKLIGKALKGKRDKVIIASKAGYCLSTKRSFSTRIKPLIKPLVKPFISWARPMKKSLLPGRSAQLPQNFSAPYITEAVEASLRRLQTDYLDVFQLHDPPSTLLENCDIIETLEDLKLQGKIRYYGVACRTVEDALISLKYPGFSSLQVEINLLNQEAITKLLPLSEQKNIAIIARQPFAAGLLIKPPIDGKSTHDFTKQAEVHNKIKQIERQQLLTKNCTRTMMQLALEFVLQFESISVVVAGMSNRKHLEENLAALTALPFSKEELATLY
ncbi:aldo/keto reductase [Tolypothrix sp. FACHB-123]|uniref:aldo/keto reductase n=1 Tax=Tolypothrix sp. FACHB-123 TaxID=2692868 RepID=UPI001686BE4F|nr:aldo/keto reductase [Tolypothrix sp. FACHB-123]MBD2359405.1 aldo/keto reductase [Tolypothrix sp. FACHB-123]